MDSNLNEPQQTQFNSQPTVPPDNNLVWAILCTVLCCLPFGIYAIVCSTKVNSLWVQGDYEGATKAAADAKKWSIYGAIVGIIVFILIAVVYFLMFAAIIAAAASENSSY